jgi:TP901 family phage tail tape measure protein
VAINLGTAVGYLQLDITGFARGIDAAAAEVDTLGRRVSGASGVLSKVSTGLVTTGKVLTATVTGPLVAVGAESIRASAKFDSAMSKVKAITNSAEVDLNAVADAAKNMGVSYDQGATDSETAFNAVRAAAIKMGNDTKFTAEESAEALYYMGLAGWNAQEEMEGLRGILDLAAASGVELGQVSDIVTDGLTAFKLEAKDSTMFADTLAAASANSNTNVDLLGQSFKYVAPVAGSYGYSIQDVTLALGLMASAGVKGTQAGTGLRQALVQMTKPTEASAELMDKYGVSLFDANGKTRELRDIIYDLRGTFGDLDVALYDVDGNLKDGEQILEEYGHSLPTNDFEKLNTVAQVFGVRALPGIMAMIEATDENFDQLAYAVDNASEAYVRYNGKIYTIQDALNTFGDAVYNDSSFEILGASAGQAGIMMDNLQGDWTLLTSAFGTTKVILSDMVNGVLRGFVQSIKDMLVTFNNMAPAQQKNIVKLLGIAAAIGPVMFIVGKLIGLISMLASGVGVVTTAVGALNFPAIISAIGSIVSAFNPFTWISSLVKGFITTLTSFSSPLALIKSLATGFMTSLKSAITAVLTPANLFIAAIAILVGAFITLWKTNEEFRNNVIAIWEQVKQTFMTFIEELMSRMDGIKEAISNIVGFIKIIWFGLCELLGPVFIGAFEVLAAAFKAILDVILGIVDVFVGVFTGDWDLALKGVGEIFEAVFTYIVDFIKIAIETILNVIDVFLGWLGTSINEVLNAILDFIKFVIQGIIDIVTGIINFVKEGVPALMNFIADKIKAGINGIKEFIAGLKENVRHSLAIMKSQLKDDLAAMWQGITNFMLKIADKVKAVINNVKSMIKGFKDKFTGDVEGFKRAIRDLVEDGKRWLEGFGDTIKNLFDFEWHLPELKLPHINVGGYIDVPVLGTIPDPTLLSVDWYKKAMHNGIVMDSPTIFGWDSKSGRFLAGGEAGTEIVVGATSLIDMIRSAVASSTSVISRDINSYCSAMVDAFVSAIDIISFVLGILNEGFVSTNKALESTMSAVVSKRSEDFMSTYGVNSIYGNNTDVIDYYKLSQTFLDVLRTVQIVNNFNVEMEDGDVYLDNERVGRKIAPVVSRIQAKGV